MFKKVSVKERLPKEGVPVVTIDSKGNAITYKRFGNQWNMPKLEDNNPIEYWLEEVPFDFKQLKTYNDAVNVLPVSDEDKINENDPEYVVALKQLRHIVKVVNGQNFIVDWENGNQRKWRPWFDLSSGFRFGGSGCDWSGTGAGGGSRLCFETEEKSDYVANQFIDLYKIVILN